MSAEAWQPEFAGMPPSPAVKRLLRRPDLPELIAAARVGRTLARLIGGRKLTASFCLEMARVCGGVHFGHPDRQAIAYLSSLGGGALPDGAKVEACARNMAERTAQTLERIAKDLRAAGRARDGR